MTEHTPSELLAARAMAERHPGPFTGPDTALARACAMVTIPYYGNDDPDTYRRIMKNGIWNDHIAVQAALTVIHSLRKAGLYAAPPAASVTREVIEKAICCPDGCVRDVDCWAKHQTGHTRQVIKAILAAVSSPSTEGGNG